MRILVITDLYPPIAFGGYERTCAVLVRGLRERHRVTVLTSDLRRREAPPEPGVRRELPYLDSARSALARVPPAALRAATVTRAALEETDPDIVYVWNCANTSQAAPLTAHQAGAHVAYRLSELWYASTFFRDDRFVGYLDGGRRGLRRGWSWAVRAVNRHPSLRLDPHRPVAAAVSWGSYDISTRATLPATIRPVLERAIPSGVSDLSAGLPSQPSSPPVIAYIGRLTTAKGAELAVQALAALRGDHGLEARLEMAGPCDPDMGRQLDRLADELGVAGAVERTGQLAGEPLARLLQRASAVVVPTVAHETFGRVCAEAALARVPVVAARIGGIPETLHDREHALLFAPGDASACAAALATTLVDRSSAERRAERAFEHVQRFSVERYATQEEEFLEDALTLLKGGERSPASL